MLYKVFSICYLLTASLISFAQMSQDGIRMKEAGLVNIKDIDSTIIIDLIYTKANNFTGKILYINLKEAMLQPNAVQKLAKVQKNLNEKKPGYRIIVFDAGRPRRAQQIMWDVVKGTSKSRYVASPARISMHSYGVAVDVSIVDSNGNELDMGTPVDYLGKLAEPKLEQQFLTEGKLTKKQIENRLLLRKLMQTAGFRTISNEWWHFEACTRDEASRKYTPIA